MPPQEKKQVSKRVPEESVTDLVFGIAHQIRNPLSIIRSQAQHLASVIKEREHQQTLEAIVRSADTLNHRLEELIDFTQAIELRLQRCLPSELIEQILPVIQKRCDSQNILIKKHYREPLSPILVDYERVGEALLQIVINAIEAMPQGGELRLNISQDVVSGNTLFQVADAGVGIPMDDLKNVFLPFFTTKAESPGLGLSIARKIFQAHGGILQIESSQMEGTTITVIIPKSQGAEDGQDSDS